MSGNPCGTRCRELQERARARIPGVTQLLSKRPDRFSLGVWPAYYAKASGAEVWDADGNKYLDMGLCGIGATILGYADPDVRDAVVAAVDAGNACSLVSPLEVELAELLCELHPGMDKVRFARSGGEAAAMAVRIARACTGRDVVAFCGYHGWYDWYLAANLGDREGLKGHLMQGLDPAGVPAGLEGTALPFRYNRLDELEAILDAHPGQVAAVVMEPLRNSEPKDDFLRRVKGLAEKHGCLLVFDEISVGFRMACGGAHLALGVVPDMAVFAKAMGNGYAVSAVIGSEAAMDGAHKTFISSTNWTESVGYAAALATIAKHRRLRVHEHILALGRRMQQGWQDVAERHNVPVTVSGIPSLTHYDLNVDQPDHAKALVIQGMLAKGFLAPNSFYPMLAHREEHVDAYLEALDQVFADLAEALRADDLESRLQGLPCSKGFTRLT